MKTDTKKSSNEAKNGNKSKPLLAKRFSNIKGFENCLVWCGAESHITNLDFSFNSRYVDKNGIDIIKFRKKITGCFFIILEFSTHTQLFDHPVKVYLKNGRSIRLLKLENFEKLKELSVMCDFQNVC